jgi:hypothetical protein
MTQIFASIDFAEVNVVEADAVSLNFIEDADYEFVGGGTAVNSL